MRSINRSLWCWGVIVLGLTCRSHGQTVPLNYSLTIQPIVLLTSSQTAPSDTTFAGNAMGLEFDVAATQQIWAQAGIQINYATNIIYEHDPTDANSVNSIVTAPSGNSGSIFQGNGFTFNSSLPNNGVPFNPFAPHTLNLFMVQSIGGSTGNEGYSQQGTVNQTSGLGSVSINSGTAISITSLAAVPNVQVIAHEIGHELDLFHPIDYVSGSATSGPNFINLGSANLSVNLMQPPIQTGSIPAGSYATTVGQLYAPNSNPTGDGQLTTGQITQALKSIYNASTNSTGLLTALPANTFTYTYPTAVPEPSSTAFIAGLTVLFTTSWGVRRKRLAAKQRGADAVATHG